MKYWLYLQWGIEFILFCCHCCYLLLLLLLYWYTAYLRYKIKTTKSVQSTIYAITRWFLMNFNSYVSALFSIEPFRTFLISAPYKDIFITVHLVRKGVEGTIYQSLVLQIFGPLLQGCICIFHLYLTVLSTWDLKWPFSHCSPLFCFSHKVAQTENMWQAQGLPASFHDSRDLNPVFPGSYYTTTLLLWCFEINSRNFWISTAVLLWMLFLFPFQRVAMLVFSKSNARFWGYKFLRAKVPFVRSFCHCS